MDLTEFKEKRDSIDKETVFGFLKDKWHIPTVLAIVFTGFMLRYMPANGMEYLQAVDPYMIFRMSQHLALEGSLPQLDFARYFPYAMPTYLIYNGDIVIPALLWDAGFGLFFSNYLEWAQFYPAMLGGLSVLVMYFLGQEFFDRKTGVAAAFFLAVTPGILRRTSAGFFEKEPLGTFLMLASLLFFTRAWKRESWKNGIFSAIALGLFTISWGGSQMLWLLYPIVTAVVVFINQDIRSLVAAYTPTVLVAGISSAVLLHRRFSLDSELFIGAVGVLIFLWARYLIEELDLVEQEKLKYYGPVTAIFGLLMVVLSPLYSDFIARKAIGFFNTALGNTGGVIGGTVAENAPPNTASLAQSIGSGIFSASPVAEFIGALASPWTLMMFGVPFMATSIVLMLAAKNNLITEKIGGKEHLAYIQAGFVSWLPFIFSLVLITIQGRNASQFLVFMGAFASLVIGASLFTLIYFLDEDSALSISSLMIGGGVVGALIFVLRFSPGLNSPATYLTLVPTLMAAVASVILYYAGKFPEREIEFNWYLILPLVWTVSNVYGGTTRSRLLFLSTFSVALVAGYGLSTGLKKLRDLDYSGISFTHPDNLENAVTVFVILIVAGFGIFSGYVMSQGLGGSPSPSPQIWEQSIDFMNDTPEGSVILSWWDYGYYFQTLGERPSVADGGQGGYYTQETRAVNMPLAEYLNTTASRPEDREFIEKHSVDYIWLDRSMIGKFAAVSQIANRNNQEFDSISQVATRGSLQDSLSRDGNQTLVEFRGRLGRNRVEIYAPIESTNTSMSLSGSPTVRFANGQTAGIGCVLTEEGRQNYDVQNDIGFCAAEDPFYSLERGAAGGQPRMLLIPEKISNSTFVKLYVQDGRGVEYAEKVPEASNGYIKMWEVTE
jgi:asparagine N-glycosylation enzyme membrane subunit Stt3